jgi:enoyl-CoA hydratase
MTDLAIREDRGSIAVVTWNRPDKLNAVTKAMHAVLANAVEELRDRADLRMLLIRSKGRYFTAGMDIKEGGGELPTSAIEMRRIYRSRFQNMFDEMEKIEKPVLVAVQGPCLGLGVELAGSCDFRVASASARFGLPEIDLGVIAGSGGVSRLTRLCGVGWSKWLNVAGEQIDAATALMAGLVQAVWPDEIFEEEVWKLCERIVSRPAEVQGAAKLAVDLCHDLDRESGRHVERIINTPFQLSDRSQLVDAALKR